MTLKCSFKYISIPKLGNSFDENDDSILIPSISELENEPIIKFAISDGATESTFSKEWSSLLVNSYKDKPFDLNNLPFTINEISKKWYSDISIKELPWYAQQKLEIGAFATFLGVTIYLKNHTFEAVSIGDCTLFQIRNNKLINSFPIKSFNEFNNTPYLFATNPKFQTDFTKTVKYLNGRIEKDDILILASDSLAKWIIKCHEINKGEITWLISLLILLKYDHYQIDFSNWISEKIKDNEIKNDDISIIFINFE